ncbi:DNA translocase FtsK 4TM domain-containing protein [Vreelandella aquamarina]|uniref:DNA translocase FtsK n=1 Tax=Vreelandella aquamarina TaxID=77097 RepID=UPI00384BE47B
MNVKKTVNRQASQGSGGTPKASSERVNVAKAKAKAGARHVGVRLQGVAREAVVIVLLALCVFLLLALFSYQAGDPGWSYRGPETEVANWMGALGAWLADVMYSLLGSSALWFPGVLAFTAWWLMRSRQVTFRLDMLALAVRVAGFVMLLLGTTLLGAQHFFSPDSILPYGAGGIIGEGLVTTLLPVLSHSGVGLVAGALILGGFPILTGVSWLELTDEIGHQACRLGRRVRQLLGGLETKRREHQAKRRPYLGDDDSQQETPGTQKQPVFSADEPASAESASPQREPRVSLGTAAGATAAGGAWAATRLTASRHTESALAAEDSPRPTTSESNASPGVADSAVERAAHSGVERLEDNADNNTAESVPEPSRHAINPAAFTASENNTSAPHEEVTAKFPERIEPRLGSEWPSESTAFSASGPEQAPDANERTAAVSEQPVPERRVPEIVPEPVLDDDPDWPQALESAFAAEPQTEGELSKTGDPREQEPASMLGASAPPSVSTADPVDDESMTLWTVEHLQNQRPVLEGMPEPDGDVPSLRLLTPPEPQKPNYSEQQLADMAELLEIRLKEYGVKAEVVDTWPGPVITRFEIKPAAGVKVSKITNLAKDLARSLMVKSVRVVEVIPGRPTVGIEIPNPNRAMIRLREVVDSDLYQQETSPLTMALGQDIGGGPVVANLGKMPHLLVAGTTGSGKSVGVNAMLVSMLLKATPDELRLIMVDPKMLELSVYDGIPHLLAPVVTDMKEAANSLRWCVAEMERRYKLMAAMGVRNIAGFNSRLDEADRAGAQVADPLWEPQPWEMHQAPPVLEKLPYIVVVIDEFADMFMIVGKKVEELIARLAQKARAAGIHLILATQRPSVDVVTGLIKANIPSRMAFQVSSRIDSRTILDQGGAESLLGHGDMLYLPAGSGPPNRVHGAFVDDDEVHRVVEDWKLRGEPEYIEEILTGGVSADALAGLEAEGTDNDDAEQDALYDEAVQFVTETRKASISAVQRRFKIGYNRAARLVDAMESAGVVSSMGSNGQREVLANAPTGH